MTFYQFILIVTQIIYLGSARSVESYRNKRVREHYFGYASRLRHQSHYFYNDEQLVLPGRPYPYADLNFELTKCLNLR